MADFHVMAPGEAADDRVALRQIGLPDIVDALRRGWEDFSESRSHYLFMILLYPIIGFTLFAWMMRGNALELVYPLVTGFALLGPVAAVGLYEISRRRERGQDTAWRHAFGVLRAPAIPSIAALGLWLLGLFLAWIFVAGLLYGATMGGVAYDSIWALIGETLSTARGWTLIVLGNLIGAGFAIVTLCTTVVSFPLLLDRDVGAVAAVRTSARAVLANPVALIGWGLIVATLLFAGAVVFLVGLIIVLPVLGHATWHIYRKLVVGSGPGAQSRAQV